MFCCFELQPHRFAIPPRPHVVLIVGAFSNAPVLCGFIEQSWSVVDVQRAVFHCLSTVIFGAVATEFREHFNLVFVSEHNRCVQRINIVLSIPSAVGGADVMLHVLQICVKIQSRHAPTPNLINTNNVMMPSVNGVV